MRFTTLLCLLLTGYSSVFAQDTSPKLRVLTYNIHHGEGGDGKLDLERIAAVIKTAEPDLAALQEVDQSTTRSKGVDQAARLSELTGMTVHFGKAMDYSGGGYGLAVLSRWPLHEMKTHPLPAGPGVEPRIVLEAMVQVPGQSNPLRFLVTHVDHKGDPKDRTAQVQKILELFPVGGSSEPAILAGDFNATPKSKVVKSLLASWTDTAPDAEFLTSPAATPRNRIDYIFIRPQERWKVIETRPLDEPTASDHRPVLSILEL